MSITRAARYARHSWASTEAGCRAPAAAAAQAAAAQAAAAQAAAAQAAAAAAAAAQRVGSGFRAQFGSKSLPAISSKSLIVDQSQTKNTVLKRSTNGMQNAAPYPMPQRSRSPYWVPCRELHPWREQACNCKTKVLHT